MSTFRFASSTTSFAMVAAFPELVTSPVKFALVVTVEALPVNAPVKVVAVTELSLTRTLSMVTPASEVVSEIVSVVMDWLAETIILVEPVVLQLANTSAQVSEVSPCAST